MVRIQIFKRQRHKYSLMPTPDPGYNWNSCRDYNKAHFG